LRTAVPSLIAVRQKRRRLILPGLLIFAGAAEAVLVYFGRTYGSTARERMMALPGDDIIATPEVATNHAITIDAPPESVWPWLTQMGWHRAGWYTARWVDRLLFPANWPSADRLIPELQDIKIGLFIPDGPPETKCGFIVEDSTLTTYSFCARRVTCPRAGGPGTAPLWTGRGPSASLRWTRAVVPDFSSDHAG
jgi:hypothetical protein